MGAEGFNYTIPDLWAAMRPRYCAAKEACDAFNATNAWRKRGVHLMPTKYIMAMDFWKIAALVQIFADGSVQVAHGGSELGQGIHTKVAAAAPRRRALLAGRFDCSPTKSSKAQSTRPL